MARLILLGAASFAALTLAACGDNMSANNTTMPTETPAVNTAAVDVEAAARKAQDFINGAGQASLVEIRTSEMALEKSKDPDVKAFAQMMIDQHKAATDKLKAASSAAALAPPTEMLDDFHMRRINDLVETDGDADFDADYAALQVDAHNDALKLVEGYSKEANATPQIKAFADEMLTTLTTHKMEAEKLRDGISKVKDKSNPS